MKKARENQLVKKGNEELRDYESGQDIYSLFELDDLLNQQSARIKELEKENQQLKEYLLTFLHRISNQNEEILQLKQSQNQKAIEVLEDINKTIRLAKELCIGESNDYHRCLDNMKTIVNNQIKKLRGSGQ